MPTRTPVDLATASYRASVRQLTAPQRDALAARLERRENWDRIAARLGVGTVDEARETVSLGLLRLAGEDAPECPRVKELVIALADGCPIEWEHELASAADRRERRLVERLRAVELATRGDAPTTGPGTTDERAGSLSPGEILGDRYRVSAFLGRGGMGEVWRAFDLKLRLDVALKTVVLGHAGDERALEGLRREVRAARDVVSPNVCRIYDLVEVDGCELVSMEFIDGRTLIDLLRDRGPLEPAEASEIASQLLAGLEAIHRAGLVHRDVKPENVMITRSGRVVLMDFGLAKPVADDRTLTIAGTPAYMAPEQALGSGVDARTDVFSTGVLLAEMIGSSGTRETRDPILRGVREDPPRLPDSHWRPVLLRAVAPNREDRFPSARALMHALEQLALRVEGAEEKQPYPGLASFTDEDAEFFFGRELEVEALWNKLQQSQLLAVIGPSGSGKSSFLRAGVIPTMPEGWRAVTCHPGDRPFTALARALAEEFADDPQALQRLLQLEEPEVAVGILRRWRERHAAALLVVDQFEELFTLNDEDVQGRFAALLGRLALEADVHVLLAMRDDFLFHCYAHPALTPILSELTLLGAPSGAALRRAIVQPALLCGYRLEDEALVEEMLEDVGRERGALPLLAFALARLWQHRDRDSGRLTRAAYERIGGVGGALAQHAEATVERIGEARLSIVRELFRNLVTAQGTRATRDTEELLTVFDEREPAEQVLRQLVDARLLTSYEIAGDDGERGQPRRRVEIIHESLLAAWPRLVRWRLQDADSAQMRDQLGQAARVWKDRARSDDLLWTGTAFREFQLWLERYPGGLTAVEESFAQAMTEKARRRTRSRRLAVSVAFALLLAVLAGVSLLWRRSEESRRQAVLEARRAEAAKLHGLGQVALEDSPSEALAYAVRSLELVDNQEVRQFVVKALSRGPTAIRFVDEIATFFAEFTGDGNRLIAQFFTGLEEQQLRLWSISGGDPTQVLELPSPGLPMLTDSIPAFGARADLVATYPPFLNGPIRWRSFPDLNPIQEWSFDGAARPFFVGDGERLVVVENRGSGYRLWSWSLGDDEPVPLGEIESPMGFDSPNFRESCVVDPGGEWLAYAVGPELRLVPIDQLDDAHSRVIGRHDGPIFAVVADSTGSHLASMARPRDFRVWTVDGTMVRTVPGEVFFRHRLNAGGSMLANNTSRGYQIWDLEAPPHADPVELRLSGTGQQQFNSVSFHPNGRWVVTTDMWGGAVWPLARDYPLVLRGHDLEVYRVAVAPDGRYAVSSSFDSTTRIWPLSHSSGARGRVLFENPGETDHVEFLTFDAEGRHVLASHKKQVIRVIPVDGGPTRELDLWKLEGEYRYDAALDRRGRHAVWIKDDTFRIWDIDADEIRDLGPANPGSIGARNVVSTRDGRLFVAARGYLREWNLDAGTSRIVTEPEGNVGVTLLDLSSDDRVMITCAGPTGGVWSCSEPPVYRNLETGESRELTSHGAGIMDLALAPDGRTVVTAGLDGVARVGSVTGGPVHLLLGHEGAILSVRITPDGRRVVTGGKDRTLRLWPMPEGRPFHTLPYEEFLSKTRALTNFRAVEDAESSTGYRIAMDPFPGWADVPTW